MSINKIEFKNSNKNYSILIGSNIYSILSSKIKATFLVLGQRVLIFEDKMLEILFPIKIE